MFDATRHQIMKYISERIAAGDLAGAAWEIENTRHQYDTTRQERVDLMCHALKTAKES